MTTRGCNSPELMPLMNAVKKRVEHLVGEGRVVTGPFAGMQVWDNAVWQDGNYTAKLIGCYEQELHPAIERALKRKPRTIINVGCSDGYYAIGMRFREPNAEVFAFDIDAGSLTICQENARRNRVRVQVALGNKRLDGIKRGRAPRLYIFDVEGDESWLFGRAEEFRGDDIIVECHDFFFVPPISLKLAVEFQRTHEVELIQAVPPNPGDFPFLKPMPFGMLMLAITEMRPMPTTWLALWAK